VALANKITDPLQVTVQHHPWVSDNTAGEPQFGDPVARRALVERKRRLIRTEERRELIMVTLVTFIGPVTANGSPNRDEPIDPRDKVVLPDGTTGPILDVQGLLDPLTSRPYLYEVALG